MVEPASLFSDGRVATEAELSGHGSDPHANRIYLGNFYRSPSEAGTAIHYQDDRHVLIFGPTGSGKTMRFLIPNLLLGLENKSVIVIDPKGEIAHETAKHRRSLGHEVVILNPFNVRGLGSAGFNPLARLDPDSDAFYDDAAAIGEALIKIEGSEPHWSQSAQGLITALLMWEKLRRGDAANLENVRQMLTEADAGDWIQKPDGGQFYRPKKGLRFTAAMMADQGGYEIESLAARFIGDTNELKSIQSTADTQTRWLLSKPMREDTKRDGINFATLKTKPKTVYVILPAERLRTHSVWLRLVIVSALRALYTPGGLRTVMMIDEMAALGHLAPLEDAFALIRGFNIQLVGILQDLGQLEELYGTRWETFIANAGAVVGFAPNDLKTADWMSKRSGQMTVVAKGFSENQGQSTGGQGSTNSGSGLSEQQVGRPVFLPHELIGFEKGTGLSWLASLAYSIRFHAPFWWQYRACRERSESGGPKAR